MRLLSRKFAECGAVPWTAADALVGPGFHSKSRTRGVAADEGRPPHFRDGLLVPAFNRYIIGKPT
jgi:hypothetical protein